MIAGAIKTIAAVGIIALLAGLIFHVSILSLGVWIPVYSFILLTFGFAAGMAICGLIYRFNTDIQSLAWGLIYIFQPISAVLYPVQALPVQIRWTAYLSPITYVTENARAQLAGNSVRVDQMLIGIVMSLILFLFGYIFMMKMYNWSRRTGEFARLGN